MEPVRMLQPHYDDISVGVINRCEEYATRCEEFLHFFNEKLAHLQQAFGGVEHVFASSIEKTEAHFKLIAALRAEKHLVSECQISLNNLSMEWSDRVQPIERKLVELERRIASLEGVAHKVLYIITNAQAPKSLMIKGNQLDQALRQVSLYKDFFSETYSDRDHCGNVCYGFYIINDSVPVWSGGCCRAHIVLCSMIDNEGYASNTTWGITKEFSMPTILAGSFPNVVPDDPAEFLAQVQKELERQQIGWCENNRVLLNTEPLTRHGQVCVDGNVVTISIDSKNNPSMSRDSTGFLNIKSEFWVLLVKEVAQLAGVPLRSITDWNYKIDGDVVICQIILGESNGKSS